MKMSIKEKAGVFDTHRIFEGLHLNREFIENMADVDKRKTLDPDCVEEGEKHFKICDECLKKLAQKAVEPKDQDLPL